MIWSRSVTAACCSFVRKKIWGAIFDDVELEYPRLAVDWDSIRKTIFGAQPQYAARVASMA